MLFASAATASSSYLILLSMLQRRVTAQNDESSKFPNRNRDRGKEWRDNKGRKLRVEAGPVRGREREKINEVIFIFFFFCIIIVSKMREIPARRVIVKKRQRNKWKGGKIHGPVRFSATSPKGNSRLLGNTYMRVSKGRGKYKKKKKIGWSFGTRKLMVIREGEINAIL